jgi:hypothetical protein
MNQQTVLPPIDINMSATGMHAGMENGPSGSFSGFMRPPPPYPESIVSRLRVIIPALSCVGTLADYLDLQCPYYLLLEFTSHVDQVNQDVTPRAQNARQSHPTRTRRMDRHVSGILQQELLLIDGSVELTQSTLISSGNYDKREQEMLSLRANAKQVRLWEVMAFRNLE